MVYKITYPDSGIIQYKICIDHNEWLDSKKLSENQQKKKLEYLSKGMEWFTDQSPLYFAIFTGILDCNGIHKCIVTQFAN